MASFVERETHAEQLDTIIGEKRVYLSVVIKQRLSIARAFLRNRSV